MQQLCIGGTGVFYDNPRSRVRSKEGLTYKKTPKHRDYVPASRGFSGRARPVLLTS